jgi:L-lactate dehydrogenase complex protein LldG
MSAAKEAILARISEARVQPRSEIVAQFVEYARDYKANVVEISREDVKRTVADLLKKAGSQKVVVPPDLSGDYLPSGFEIQKDDNIEAKDLDTIDASVTCCAAGVAETGTFVLDGGEGQGRRALTLVPDHHICLIKADQIVDSVEEAVANLYDSVVAGRPLTWVSGPSATSDIELTRVEGVHGARRLDIVVIG